MINLNRTLKFFCKTYNFDIKSEKKHANYTQYEINDGIDSVLVSVYITKDIDVQGNESELKQLFLLWANQKSTLTLLRHECSLISFSLEWKEWKDDARILKDILKTSGTGNVFEDSGNIFLRDRLFHDYMFRSRMNCTIKLNDCIELIRSWFDKNCFQNIPEGSFIKDFEHYISEYRFDDDDNITLDVIGECLSQVMGFHCPKKMCKYKDRCGCSQMGTDNTICVFNLVDYLYPYSTANSVVAFNKSNLQILTGLRSGDVSWKTFEPSSPIEEIMDSNLRNAKLPIIPQFQAYSDMHKYRLDFLLETNCQYKIGIECDGLEYHARPGQYLLDRKRDRYLQEHNILPLRFSGPEIFNNINDCIKEIDEYLWKIKNDQVDISKPYRTSYFGLE